MIQVLIWLLVIVQSEALQFLFGVKQIPHPDKVEKGGEDAFFVNPSVISVADGVGSWVLQGIDPGLYSREVCSNIEKLWNANSTKYASDAKQMIRDTAEISYNKGSSTLIVLILGQDEKLYASYIGDSSYIILREVEQRLRLIHWSTEQQHQFNFPFQIGKVSDSAEQALEFVYDIQQWDLIVVGSDGLFDNMNYDSVIQFIEDYMKFYELDVKTLRHKQLANLLAQQAFKLSLDENYNSPFAVRAKQARLIFDGGKSDDITVVVATVV